MKAYFVRHGQTNYNLRCLCNDDPTKDVHLTTLGIDQAAIVAEKLRYTPLESILVSELPRTKETAEIINRYHNLPITLDRRINDRKTGFEGKPDTEFFAAIDKSTDPFGARFNGEESFQEEKQRVYSFLEDIKQENYEHALIVTHSEILKIIKGYFKNLSDKDMWNTHFDNCDILDIEF